MSEYNQDFFVNIITKGLKNAVKEFEQLNSAQADTNKKTKETTKSSAAYHRAQQGVAQTTSNTTKSFAKQAQTLGQSTGLIRLYASMAANIFAVGAAFRALQESANFENQLAAARDYGERTGQSLTLVAQKMKEVTNNAISMEQALRNASITAAAGFDSSTIVRLTEVAKNASLALGRDLSDSLERVYKGAVKAEPELLDELGIILRLKPATEAYAAEIGKAASELTTFEKQQAIVNSILEQGEDKFGEISGAIDTNVYSQLAATFQETTKQILVLVNTALEPLVGFFAQSPTALTAAILLFASSITKQALPALLDMSALGTKFFTSWTQGLKTTANALSSFSNQARTEVVLDEIFSDAIVAADKFSTTLGKEVSNELGRLQSKYIDIGKAIPVKKFDELSVSILASAKAQGLSSDKIQILEKRLSSAAASLGMVTSNVKKMGGASATVTSVMNRQFLSLSNIIGSVQLRISSLAVSIESIIPVMSSFAAINIADIFRLIWQRGDRAEATFARVAESIATMTDETGKLTGAAEAALVGTEKLLNTTRLLPKVIASVGAAIAGLFKAIPIIGQLFLAFEFGSYILSSVADALGLVDKQAKKADETIESLVEQVDNLDRVVVRYNKDTGLQAKTLEEVNENLQRQSNVLTELRGNLNDVIDSTEGVNFDTGIFDFTGADNLDEYADSLVRIVENLRSLGLTGINDLLEDSKDLSDKGSEYLTNFAIRVKRFVEENQRSIEELREENTKLIDSFDNLNKNSEEYYKSLVKENSALEKYTISLVETIDNIKELSNEVEKATRLIGLSDQIKIFAGIDTTRQSELISTLNNLKRQHSDILDSFTKEVQNYENSWLGTLTKIGATIITTLSGGVIEVERYTEKLQTRLSNLLEPLSNQLGLITKQVSKAVEDNLTKLDEFAQRELDITKAQLDQKAALQEINNLLQGVNNTALDNVRLEKQKYGIIVQTLEAQKNIIIAQAKGTSLISKHKSEEAKVVKAAEDRLKIAIQNSALVREQISNNKELSIGQQNQIKHADSMVENAAKEAELARQGALIVKDRVNSTKELSAAEELKLQFQLRSFEVEKRAAEIQLENALINQVIEATEAYGEYALTLEDYNKVLSEVSETQRQEAFINKAKQLEAENRQRRNALDIENKLLSKYKDQGKVFENIVGNQQLLNIALLEEELARLNRVENIEPELIAQLEEKLALEHDIYRQELARYNIDTIAKYEEEARQAALELSLAKALTKEEEKRLLLTAKAEELAMAGVEDVKEILDAYEKSIIGEQTLELFEKQKDQVRGLVDDMADSFSTAFEAMFEKGNEGFKDMFDSIFKSFEQMLVDMVTKSIVTPIVIELAGGLASAAGVEQSVIDKALAEYGIDSSSLLSNIGSVGSISTALGTAFSEFTSGALAGAFTSGFGNTFTAAAGQIAGAIGAAIPYVGIAVAAAQIIAPLLEDNETTDIFFESGPDVDREFNIPADVAAAASELGTTSIFLQHLDGEGQLSSEQANELIQEYQNLLESNARLENSLVDYLDLNEKQIAELSDAAAIDLNREELADDAEAYSVYLSARLQAIFGAIEGPLGELYSLFEDVESNADKTYEEMVRLTNALLIIDSATGILGDTYSELTSIIEDDAKALLNYQKDEEILAETIARIGVEFLGLNGILEDINLTTFELSKAGIELSQSLIELFGTFENLQEDIGTYYTEFFSEQEQIENLVEDTIFAFEELSEQYPDLLQEIPATRDQFRELIESLDLTTEAGQEAFAGLIALAGAADEIYDYIEAAEDSADSVDELLSDLFDNIVDILERTVDFSDEISDEIDAILDIPVNLDDLAEAVYASLDVTDLAAVEDRLDLAEEYKDAILDTMNDQISALEEQQEILDEMHSVGQDLLDLVGDLKFDDSLSPLNIMTQFDEATTQFNALLADALSGDIEAASELGDAALTLLDLGTQVFGGTASTDYVDLFNLVSTSLTDLGLDLTSSYRTEEELLEEIEVIQQEAVAQLEDLNSGVEWLQNELGADLGEVIGDMGYNLDTLPQDFADALEPLFNDLSQSIIDVLLLSIGQPIETAQDVEGLLGSSFYAGDYASVYSTAEAAGISGAQIDETFGLATGSSDIYAIDTLYEDPLGVDNYNVTEADAERYWDRVLKGFPDYTEIGLYDWAKNWGVSLSTLADWIDIPYSSIEAWALANSLPLFNRGGITEGPALAGEQRPEAVVPLPDGRSIPVIITQDNTNENAIIEAQLNAAVAISDLSENLIEVRDAVVELQHNLGKPIVNAISKSSRRRIRKVS